MFSENVIVKSKKFSANSNIACLLIHGGCFTDGDETWNNEQAQYIADKCAVDVFTIDFSKKSFHSSRSDISNFYHLLSKRYGGRVGVIGSSSGGFLILSLLNDIKNPLFISLLCPVMDPEKREDMLCEMKSKQYKEIHDKQISYFKTRPYPIARTSKLKFDIVAATDDENVPLALIEAEIKRFTNANLHIAKATHHICYEPNNEVIEIIRRQIYGFVSAKMKHGV